MNTYDNNGGSIPTKFFDVDFDKLHEECGVFGMYEKEGHRVAEDIYSGLVALQHRGQESAGISVSDTGGEMGNIQTKKGMGLVSEVFTPASLREMRGNIGVGHVRYSTTGGSIPENAQPIAMNYIKGCLALVHNGNITNVKELKDMQLLRGQAHYTTSDSEMIAYEIVARRVKTASVEEAVFRAAGSLKGGYACIVMSPRKLVGIRDPLGLKPLVLGERDGAFILASESAAVLAVGGRVVRDVKPGEIITITGGGIMENTLKNSIFQNPAICTNRQGMLSEDGTVPAQREAEKTVYHDPAMCAELRENLLEDGTVPAQREAEKPVSYKSDERLCNGRAAHCIFEYIYFARSDSVIDGVSVCDARIRAGRALARKLNIEADIVAGVPDSGLIAAQGYGEESGIPFVLAFHKNSYVGRSFIKPTDKERQDTVHMKLSVLEHVVKGKRLILVDDSLVRGNTMRQIVSMLRNAGTVEVHVCISSPPFLYPCYYGTDVPGKNQLIATRRSREEICADIGADSLTYLGVDDLEGMVCDLPLCKACFDGRYPTD